MSVLLEGFLTCLELCFTCFSCDNIFFLIDQVFLANLVYFCFSFSVTAIVIHR